jgi:hypothetical protein
LKEVAILKVLKPLSPSSTPRTRGPVFELRGPRNVVAIVAPERITTLWF